MNRFLMAALLWFYPHSFSQRFGDEWACVTEDLLEHAKTKGPGALALAWARLLLDTFTQAPKAQIVAMGQMVWGMPPSTAGLAWTGKAWVLTKHWGVRPARQLVEGIWHHLSFFLLGMLVTGAAYNYWAEQTGLNERAGRFPAFLGMPYEMWFQLVVMCWFWWGSPKAVNQWKRQGRRLVLPAVAVFLGLSLATTPYLLKDLGLAASDAVGTFDRYKSLRDPMVLRPETMNPAQWTAEQRQWFEVSYSRGLVKPSKQQAWCQQRRTALDREYQSMLSDRQDSAMGIRILLWRGLASMETSDGCYTTEEILAGQTALWQHYVSSPSPLQQVWERFAGVSAIADILVQGPYIVMPKVAPNIENYCASVAMEQLPAVVKAGREIDYGALASFCQSMQDRRNLDAGFQTKAIPWWRPNKTKAIKEQLDALPVFTAQELPALRQYLQDHPSQWTRPRK